MRQWRRRTDAAVALVLVGEGEAGAQRRLRKLAASKSGQDPPPDAYSSKAAGVGVGKANTVPALKQALAKCRAELHDFKLYKDVMEATLGRMNAEMEKETVPTSR